MNAKFVIGENVLEFSDFWCDDWEGTIPYNTSFKVYVHSNGEGWEEFSGLGPWECDIKDFRIFAAQLEEMDQLHIKRVEFADIAYGGKLCFELDRTGHVQVSGTLFGVHGIQSLNFALTGDQTALGPFVDGLKEFLKQ